MLKINKITKTVTINGKITQKELVKIHKYENIGYSVKIIVK